MQGCEEPVEAVMGPASGLLEIPRTRDGLFHRGRGGVDRVLATADRKVEFVILGGRALALVSSQMGYPAYYPVRPARIRKPVRAVLMDLDGTTIRSEAFWIEMIRQTAATLLGDPSFEFAEDDLPHVSGHSVSEHLAYCLDRYCPGRGVEEARRVYFQHTRREMRDLMEGRGRPHAFTPVPGVREFLLALKAAGVKIGLVTSGLYEKAWPEILDGFRTLGLGDPKEFYDAIITAGFPLRRGSPGTLGELSPKPHPWLYAETARVGLGIAPEDGEGVVGIEDSGAGVCAVRLAGFAAIGMAGGNLAESGALGLCSHYCRSFEEVRGILLA